ncbi:hypothetical protein LTS14_006585 [Recurvomyces mirabilis]|uniref:uncharacterized protein n=1 Tax=Recurvomyces mirabilis TaxID=574656 RepID=UPI002DDEC4CE|nr:hypothetical protein LTS14_006585 [Recurvomyces mirabilis]
MGATDTVALVALIVSLVALVVTTVQLLQQLSGTADGYRRCSPTVIGPWATLRKRRLLPFELRVETEYCTPEIMVVTHEKLLELRKQGLHPRVITSMSDAGDNSQQLQQTVHGSGAHLRHTARNSHMVTWLALLQEVHTLFSNYWPGDCNLCMQQEQGTSALSFNSKEVKTHITNAAVIYRQWTWDLMPSDMPRPPAITTVGDIMVLALRLGMKWRSLDFANGRIYADGCGYTLATVEGRGLGLVVSFSRPATAPVRSAIIPSQAVDKLICGILPGCPILVRRDYDFVGDDGQVLGHKMLESIGVGYELRAAKRAMGGYEPYADACALLSPFLPVLGSSAVCYATPRWSWRHDTGAVIHFWEGRMGLLHGFQTYAAGQNLNRDLQRALGFFERLQSRLTADFTGTWSEAVLSGTGTTDGTRHSSVQDLIHECESVFEFTTEYFVAQGFTRRSKDGRTLYEALVAMHVSIATVATEAVLQEVPDLTDHDRYPWLKSVPYESWVPEAYEIARAYCNTATNSEFLTKYARQDPHLAALGRDGRSLKEAWWILMLRDSPGQECTSLVL